MKSTDHTLDEASAGAIGGLGMGTPVSATLLPQPRMRQRALIQSETPIRLTRTEGQLQYSSNEKC
jgi:hypothetical protein